MPGLHALLLGPLALGAAAAASAQGGPPYFTNDPGTPGHLNWEINIGYMPFLFADHSVAHAPDVDLNLGVGEGIQLTYESAWLRVQNASSRAEFGLGQSNPGVKWRFYDSRDSVFSLSVFPQVFLNDPAGTENHAIAPAPESLLLPVELGAVVGPVAVDYEAGYQAVRKAPNGWLSGIVFGHDLTPRLELGAEVYLQGTFHPSDLQSTVGLGARYTLQRRFTLLLMAGRGVGSARGADRASLGMWGFAFCCTPRGIGVRVARALLLGAPGFSRLLDGVSDDY